MKLSSMHQPLGATAPNEIRILPAGSFRAADGSNRPADVAAWRTSATIAQAIIASSFMGRKEILIDYDHQSLYSSQNGQPALAAGWFSGLEWREGSGLYAAAIKWNAKALALIAAREYRFISPVFTYDKTTGAATRIISVAITNSPALPELCDLSEVAAASARQHSSSELASRADPRNQKGYEFLDMLNEHNRQETARLSGITNPFSKVAIDSRQFSSSELASRADPRNQRGYELLDMMNGYYR